VGKCLDGAFPVGTWEKRKLGRTVPRLLQFFSRSMAGGPPPRKRRRAIPPRRHHRLTLLLRTRAVVSITPGWLFAGSLGRACSQTMGGSAMRGALKSGPMTLVLLPTTDAAAGGAILMLLVANKRDVLFARAAR